MVCTAPEVTATVKTLGAMAASEMTCAWAESSRALNVRITLRARRGDPQLRNHMAFGRRRPGLLDDRPDVEQAGVITRNRGGTGQVEAQIQHISASAEVAPRRDC